MTLDKLLTDTGYRDNRSMRFLQSLVGCIQPKLVLELGTYMGCSATFMALGLNNGSRIATVDRYDYGNPPPTPRLVQNNLARFGVQSKVELLVGSTFDAGNLLIKKFGKTAYPEVIFMDASHQCCDLEREYESIRPVLAPRHVIVVDDAFCLDELNFITGLMRQITSPITYPTVPLPCYPFCTLLPYHWGVAVVATDQEYGEAISSAQRVADG